MQLRNKTPNDVWAMDFVHGQLATGKKLRVLTVVNTFSPYVPVGDVGFCCALISLSVCAVIRQPLRRILTFQHQVG